LYALVNELVFLMQILHGAEKFKEFGLP